jgi:hypothetical protein
VTSQDLLDDFTNWLRSHNHQKWSDKTFASRFGSHDETTRHRVEKRIQRLSAGLSMPPLNESWGEPPRSTPMRYTAWLGVRFRTAADDKEDADEEKSGSNERAA